MNRLLTYFYEQHYDRLYRSILARAGKPADAEDLTAEVFVKMLDSLEGFTWRGMPPPTALSRIAQHLTVDCLCRHTSRGTQAMLEDNIQDENCDPCAGAGTPHALTDAALALRRLTPAQQDAIQFRFASAMPVAAAIRIPGKEKNPTRKRRTHVRPCIPDRRPAEPAP